MKNFKLIIPLFLLTALIGTVISPADVNAAPPKQGGSSNSPERIVKLIFIHHSTGENWLSDGYGNLGQELAENNYYVSDTNYGWGPHGIGDRTDIPDWEEWFRSENTTTYMEALYTEGEQHADYTRTLTDPGGENEIVLFKSCFPNSNLEGNPEDSPSADGWLTVGHAKYVYNEILSYFGQHPDKLFVVITAPPLSSRSNAANARAFNLWLLNDWLVENNYPYANVVVFDFYNVLTGKDGHHTFEDGQEVHQIANKDTLNYPSGDDHPSRQGSQKATDEFIPLLNYFYNRWQSENPTTLSPIEEDSSENGTQSEESSSLAAHSELSGIFENFEGEAPDGSNGWEAYWDEGTQTDLTCSIDSSAGSSGNGLMFDYQIAPFSWGTCGLYYDQAQDWRDSNGLAFLIHTGQSGGTLHVDLYVEGPDGTESYIEEVALEPGMESDWVQIDIGWENFQRVDWEADAGSPFNKPDQISGIAFGFGTEEDNLEGVLWIDDIGWLIPVDNVTEGLASSEDIESDPEAQEESGGFNLPCIGSLVMPFGLIGVALFQKKKTERNRL